MCCWVLRVVEFESWVRAMVTVGLSNLSGRVICRIIAGKNGGR